MTTLTQESPMPLSNAQTAYQSELQGNFVAVRSGALWLFIPQSQVSATERLARLPDHVAVSDDNRPGVFTYVAADAADAATVTAPNAAEETAEYYAALSADMTLLPSLPAERFLTTVFDGSDIHWCWDEVQVLIGARLSCQDLPAVLCTDNTPLNQAVIPDDNRRGFLCDAAAVIGYALKHPTLLAPTDTDTAEAKP